MKISINNILLDKTEILSLIHNNKKIKAIKLVREQLGIGLKEAKNIVDYLDEDPTYYDGKNHTINLIPPELFNDSNNIKTVQTIKNNRQKRTPFIERTHTDYKIFIIIALIICLIILGYMYIIK